MKEITNCPICKGTAYKPFIKCQDFRNTNEQFSIVECTSCGFHFTNPIPEPDKIGDYYKVENYVSHTSSKKGMINFLYNIVRKKTLKTKVRWINQQTKGKKLLDIGSGTGHFIKYAGNSGFDVTGIEPDKDARLKGKELNKMDLFEMTHLEKLPKNKFDIITMWHVLEHIYDLHEELKQTCSLLKKDGHLFIAVPNMDSFDAKYYKSFWGAYDVPRHLYHFKEKNIKELLSQYGFRLKKVIPMKYDSFYVSMISEKYKKRFFLFGFFIGLLSNLRSKKGGYSSQVYVFEQKK